MGSSKPGGRKRLKPVKPYSAPGLAKKIGALSPYLSFFGFFLASLGFFLSMDLTIKIPPSFINGNQPPRDLFRFPRFCKESLPDREKEPSGLSEIKRLSRRFIIRVGFCVIEKFPVGLFGDSPPHLDLLDVFR